MQCEVLNRDENLIEKIAKDDPEYKRVLNSIVERKKKDKTTKKEIAEITKEILNSEAVRFDDDVGVTFGELMVAGAIANNISNKNLGFKELGDLQKVLGEQAEEEKGVVINVITNGQDLGD